MENQLYLTEGRSKARLTTAGNDLDVEFDRLIGPLFKQWIERGYSPREISHVMLHALISCELMWVLDWEPVLKQPE